MKLCFIAEAATVHAQKWMRYFAGTHEVHVISHSLSGDAEMGNIRVHMLKHLSLPIGGISSFTNLAVNAVQVRNMIKQINPDIVHAHYITDNGLLGAVSGFHPLIVSAWGSDVLIDPERNLPVKVIDKYIFSKADLLTCDSEILKKGLLKLGADENRVFIIFHGVDTTKFSPQNSDENLRSRLGIDGSEMVISTRTLSPVYNVEMLIKAVPLVLREVPSVKFVIVGEGKEKERLQNMAKALGVNDSVKFIGWVPNDELPKYLSSSDVYVSTSVSDSTALSLQEAMATEVAPVVTDLPANREWIKDGENGCLVPVNGCRELAAGIVRLLSDAEMRNRFGRASRKLIVEKAEYNTEMAKMGQLYKRLVM